jgi:hypothetical protein
VEEQQPGNRRKANHDARQREDFGELPKKPLRGVIRF